jgi:uncharacterized membrane protein YbhN (UPF0104 family)/tRNA A-37 threonylcarbamoyl transferase component Bud32
MSTEREEQSRPPPLSLEPVATSGESHPESTSDVRIRRPGDALEALGAVLGLVIVFSAAHGLPVATQALTRSVARSAAGLPRLLVVAFAVLDALAVIAVLVAVGASLVRRRPRDGVNAIASGAVAACISIVVVAAWHAFPGGIAAAMLHGTDGSTLVRDAVIVSLATGSDTVRYTGWGRYVMVTLAALLLSGVALNELTFFGAVVATLGGSAIGLLIRFALRSTVSRPSIPSLRDGLTEAGLAVRSLERPRADSPDLEGVLGDGRPIQLRAAGREGYGAGLLRTLWSAARLRGVATGPQIVSRRSALEREALASLMAATAGVIAPKALLLTHFEPDTLVLVLERIGGTPMDTSIDDEQLRSLFASLRRLHRAGVAHRDLRRENIVNVAGPGPETGRLAFASLSTAVVGAGELLRRLDVVQLLATTASVIGAERSIEAMRAGYGPLDEHTVAAIMQPVALTGWGWSEMRSMRRCLADVRQKLVGERHSHIPEIRLERFRWRTVLSAVTITLAAFVLVGQLTKVNLAGALQRADWAWFSLALVGSTLSYLGSSLNLLAFVPKRLPVLKVALVELSGAFFGLVTPASVGRIAVNGRFLHRQGVEPTTTAAAVGLSQLVNVITTVVLIVVTTLLTGTGTGNLKIVPGPRLLGVLGGLVVLGALLITVVPFTRNLFFNRLWPRVREAWPQLLEVLSQPMRLLQGIGGNLLTTGSYVLALIASLEAVGAHPPIIATAAVFMAGNAVGAAAPTPGGIGAVEAVMAAGLAVVGIAAHEAVPAVLLFRLATFWIPALLAWPLFVMLQRRAVI